MNCMWCGRKKQPLEHMTPFGFCHRCDTLVRRQLRDSLMEIRGTVDACVARELRARAGGLAEPYDDALLARLDDALARVFQLEELRAAVPFFVSSLDDARSRLAVCRTLLRPSEALPPPPARDRLPGDVPPALQERLECFRARLQALRQVPLEPVAAKKNMPRRTPIARDRMVCARIATGSDTAALQNYIALDVKATGRNPRRDNIVEISAVLFAEFEPQAVLTTRILPPRPILPRAARRCGVYNETVRGMPLIDEMIPQFKEFLRDAMLVGYDLPLDMQFLSVYGILPPQNGKRLYDVPQLAQSFLSAPNTLFARGAEAGNGYDVRDYSLPTLCEHYTLDCEPRSRPGADCLSVGMLFRALVLDRTGMLQPPTAHKADSPASRSC